MPEIRTFEVLNGRVHDLRLFQLAGGGNSRDLFVLGDSEGSNRARVLNHVPAIPHRDRWVEGGTAVADHPLHFLQSGGDARGGTLQRNSASVLADVAGNHTGTCHRALDTRVDRRAARRRYSRGVLMIWSAFAYANPGLRLTMKPCLDSRFWYSLEQY